MKHNQCVACGTTDNLCQHHLVPRSLGGSDDENNLLTLCGSCHAKAHQIQANWRHSELTKSALQHKKSKGERVGSIPYGYHLADDGETLVEDEAEQQAITVILQQRSAGLSLRTVVSRLEKQGYVSRTGKPLGLTQVARIASVFKVIDMAGVKRTNALVADALCCNPHGLDRLTIGDIEMALSEEKTVVVSLRMPKELAEKAEALARKLAYTQDRHITRTSLIIEILEQGIMELEDDNATDQAALALADTGEFEDWQTVKARNGL